MTDVTITDAPIEGVQATTPIYDAPIGEPAETPSFLESIPENIRSEKAFENVKSLDDLANQYLNAQKMIGKKTIGLPTDESTPEEVSSFYEKLRPETAEGYEFGTEHLPEGTERDAELDGKVKSLLHEAGLSKDQARKVVEGYEKMTLEMNPVLTDEQKEQAFEKKGREILGSEYEAIVDNAMKVGGEFVPDSVKEIVKGFADDQLLAFAAVINNVQSKYMSEDTSGHNHEGTSGVMSEADRRAKASALLAEMDKVGPMSPKYEELNAQRKALYKR